MIKMFGVFDAVPVMMYPFALIPAPHSAPSSIQYGDWSPTACKRRCVFVCPLWKILIQAEMSMKGAKTLPAQFEVLPQVVKSLKR